jgi:ssDNA-binding replication factor A large subunit
MILGNYEKIVGIIAKSSGLGEDEIRKRVEEKRNKLSGLISKEGAAQVIAAELGISFDNEKLKINEIGSGMKRVNTLGKVLEISPVRTFTRNGSEGKVVNLRIADETSNIKVVLWDVHHIDLIEKGDVAEGKVVDISNASMRDGELHLGSFSEMKLSSENVENVIEEKVFQKINISEINSAREANIRAFVVQVFDPRFFYVCPECRKKVVQEGDGFKCGEHGKVAAEKRALINLVLDDGTETIRTVLFSDTLPQIGINSLDNLEELKKEKEELLGREMVFSGNIRNNAFFNNLELIATNVESVNFDELLSEFGEK